MRKFLSVCRKEMLLLVRDIAGLAMLFIMPVTLVLISSLMQEAGWGMLSKDPTINVLFVDNDHDDLGRKIGEGFRSEKGFHVIDSLDGRLLTAERAREAVKRGDYTVAIVIPENATGTLRKHVRLAVAKTLAGFGMGNPALLSGIRLRDSVEIALFFDPAVKSTFKNALVSSVKANYYHFQSAWIFSAFNREMSAQMPMYRPPDESFTETLRFREEYPTYKESEAIPNTTQHNVPAWTIFAMFFIVIPLTQSLIQEREGGSQIRLLTLPVNYMTLLMGKVAVYLLVCLVQMSAMLLAGVFVLPLIGLPRLVLAGAFGGLLAISLVVALAAVGYGLMIGTVARTHQQAAAFGSISVIILAAVGGLWVPIYLMPPFMTVVAGFSPLNWAITAFYNLFLRGGGMVTILPQAAKLLAFFAATVALTAIYQRIRRPMNN